MSDIVSIHDDEDVLAGSGVLVTDDLVLTCAHVVNNALGRGVEDERRPEAGKWVSVRFNGAPNEDPCKAYLDTEQAAWSAPPAQRAPGADLCVLRLSRRRPSGAIPALVQAHRFRSDFPARASGYPDDWNKKAPSPKLDADLCQVLEQDGYLWLVRASDGSRLAAVLTKSRSAGLIHSGFSGGPLKKGERLVGLLVRARSDPRDATAYAIPAHNFPEYVLRSAQALSDEIVALADTERRSVAAARASQSYDQEIASAPRDADETGRDAGPALDQEDLADELISSYSTVFVGRSEEADRIRSLVRSEQPGYLFVRGEPGAGKSALLAHLVQELRTRDSGPSGAFLIYHFIRQEQGDLLRVLSSLNVQMAKALGEFSPYGVLLSLEDQFKALWKRLMLHAGRDRPALLVLDGLDELEEPSSLGRWLPAHLAPYTHVVASGRTIFDPYRHLPNLHVARSAGPPIVLWPLGPNNVEQLLELQLQNPAAAARLVEPVFGVTKGFALKTRLLAKDIAENGEAVLLDEARLGALMRDYLGEEARHLTEGAEGSLRRRALAVLAEARGPLTPEDLRGILLGPDQGDMDRALQPVLRCLASPVSLEFLHLELKRAVGERLTSEEKVTGQTALSRWMRSAAQAGGADPIPAYVLDHFVDECRTAGLKAIASTIVSERWRSSRYARRGSHADYITDLDRIREQSASSGPDWQILCQVSYVRAQLHTVAAALPSVVLLLLADLGRIDEASDYARLQPSPLSRVWALTRLSSRYRQRGEGGKAKALLARAEAALEHMSSKERCSALQILASSFQDAGDLSEAKRMAKSCRDTVPLVKEPYERSKALGEAIDASAAAGDFDAAIELVQSQANAFAYFEYVERVAVPLAQSGVFERLLERMSKSQPNWIVDHAIGNAAPRLADAGFVADAKRLAGLARSYPYQGLVNICESLARRGDIEGCLSTLGEIGLRSRQELLADLTGFRRWLGRWNIAVDWLLRDEALQRYDFMASDGRLIALKKILLHLQGKIAATEAHALAHSLIALVAIESGRSSIRARAELVGWLAESGAADVAVELARKIRDEVVIRPLSRDARKIASTALGKAGKWDEAYAALEPLLAIDDSGNADQSDEIRHYAAEALARSKKYDEALAQCDQIKNQGARAYGLAVVAAELVSADVARAKAIASTALDLVRTDNSVEKQNVAYGQAIAFAFARRALAQEAHAAACLLEKSVRDDALGIVVYLLSEAGNIDGAETAALAISDWDRRRDKLLYVMRKLLRSQQYERAFTTANKFPYEGHRFDALAEWIEVVLAKRPQHERNTWLTKVTAATQGNSSAGSLEFRGRLGRAALKAGDRDGAETILANTLALAYGNPTELARAHVGLALACVDRHPQDARSIVSRSLTGESFTKDAALVLAQLGDWDQVALRIGETSGLARVRLLAAVGETAARRGAKDKASECLGQLNDILVGIPDAEQSSALTEAAHLHWLLGDANRARELCKKAYGQIAQSSNVANLNTLATPIARAGQKDVALQCLAGPRESVRSWQQADIAEALADSGASNEAAELAQAVLESLGADLDFWNEMVKQKCSNALATAGRPDLALEVALQIDDPAYKARALIDLARTHQKAGRALQAGNALSQSFAAIAGAETGPLGALRAEAAALLFDLGRLEHARSELIAAFAQAVGAGVEAFVETVRASAPVLAAELPDGGALDLIDGLERASMVLRESRRWSIAA